MTNTYQDSFNARQSISTALGERTIYCLDALNSLGDINRLPYTIKVLLESCLRNLDGHVVNEDHIKALASYDPNSAMQQEIPFTPGRVVLQDFTGVPAMVDLAAMRSAMVRMGGNPKMVNPLVPCDLIIDHSVQVDAFNSGQAITINGEMEFDRNRERYEFLKWGQSAFDNFRVIPPGVGIVHQVNLEYLAKVVWDHNDVLYPDSLVGTDSHTTMINGLGVLGWGVGGIEAEAVMLGQPIYMLIPEVVGLRLIGKLPEGCTATDLVLRVTQLLRQHGVVGKFVEFFGSGLDDMPLANRATIANMAPEYGATVGFFPIDKQTLAYMNLSGRSRDLIQTVEQYCKTQGLWRDESYEIIYSASLDLDLGTIEPALAGPKRPQDRIVLADMQTSWHNALTDTFDKSPPRITTSSTSLHNETELTREAASVATLTPQEQGVSVELEGKQFKLNNGHVVIAAITSCTNTSNPSVMIGAGLVAQKANKLGLKRKPWVKTSLAPGSKVVTEYLNRAGLMHDLESLGFYLVGYGCTTCIGNSGPLPGPIDEAIIGNDLVVAAVLSGNRNFEGRIHANVKANYLASPPLVVAYAISGTVDIDLTTQPIGSDQQGNDVFLSDIWPSQGEIQQAIDKSVAKDQFIKQYAHATEGSREWQAIEVSGGEQFAWPPASTYIQEPPFFVEMPDEAGDIASITNARCLVKVADSVTTDHISPAGSIGPDTPAGEYLIENGVAVSMFNSFGSRRGNDRVMTRGTFANVRMQNQLAPGTEGGVTTDFTTGNIASIYEASLNYKINGTSLIVLAGSDYGMGSSRDWAAKGTLLLGVKAVIAKSFERIHRSNLVGMGVLPLTFREGQDAESLGLTGSEIFDIYVPADPKPRQDITIEATNKDGTVTQFTTICRIDTPVEIDYYRNGGILHTVLRKMAKV